MNRKIILGICYLALATTTLVVNGEESKDDKGNGVRATRSISNIARLLLGGNVPPDHPLVHYPEPIQNAASNAKNSVIAAVPGMNGKRAEFGPMPAYPPPVHTPGTPPITPNYPTTSPWGGTNQGYNNSPPPLQQQHQLPVSNSLAYSNSYYSGAGESSQSSPGYPQPQQGQANPPGLNSPGNYYNAPSNAYNAPPTPFPPPGNAYDASGFGSGRGFGSSAPSFGNGGGGGNGFPGPGNPNYAPYTPATVHLPEQYRNNPTGGNWPQPTSPYASPPQNYQQSSQVNYAQASSGQAQGPYPGQGGQAGQANGYNGGGNYFLNNQQQPNPGVFNNPNTQYQQYPNQPPQNYNPYAPYNANGQPPQHQFNNNFPVGPASNNYNNNNYNVNSQGNYNHNYPPPPSHNYNHPNQYPRNEEKHRGANEDHSRHEGEERVEGHRDNPGRPHGSTYKSKDYNRHRGEYSDKYPENNKVKGHSGRPSYSSHHKPSSSYKKSYYDDYPSVKEGSSGKYGGSSGSKSQYRTSSYKTYNDYNKPSSPHPNKYRGGSSKNTFRSYNKDSQKYRKNYDDYRRNSFSVKSGINEQVEDMLGEATTIAFEIPVASTTTAADKHASRHPPPQASTNHHSYRHPEPAREHPEYTDPEPTRRYRTSTEATSARGFPPSEFTSGSGRRFAPPGSASGSSGRGFYSRDSRDRQPERQDREPSSGSSRPYHGRERWATEESARDYYGRRPHRSAGGADAQEVGEEGGEKVHSEVIKEHLPKDSSKSEIIPSIAIFQASYVS